MADLYAFYSRRRANKFHKTGGKIQFFPDNYQLHVQARAQHSTSLILEPFTEGNNLTTGKKFYVNGLKQAPL
jgi:hypothetical protein